LDSYLQERYERRINGLRLQVVSLEEENEDLKRWNRDIVAECSKLKTTVHRLINRSEG